MSQNEIVGKILFEISHLVRGHYKRFAKQLGFDPTKIAEKPPGIEEKRKIWTESARLELVDDFDEEGLKLPEGIRRADDWNVPTKLLAEHYYARLQKHGGQQGGQGGGQGKKQQNQKSGKGQSGKGKAGQQQQQQQQNQQPQPHDPEIDGSAADGCPREWEEPAPAGSQEAEANGGQASQIPGLTDDEAELIRRNVAEKTLQHAKNQGRVPAGMRRWAEEVATPRIDYRQLVLQKVRRAILTIKGNRDYSYKRPARRNPGNGVINPALIDHTLNLAVVIDSSGSMSNTQLGEAVKILAGIIKALPRRDAVRVFAADAACYDVQKIFDASTLEICGGGGTEMGLAIVHASNLKPRPDLVVVITDGLTSWPAKPSNNVPCVSIILERDFALTPPSWIDVITIPHLSRHDEEDSTG